MGQRVEGAVNVNDLTVQAHILAKQFAKINGMRKDLVGLCAITTVSLYLTLKVFGVEAVMKHGKTKPTDTGLFHHCWVEINGKVYDPTFLQFDRKNPVYIGNKTFVHDVFVDVEDIENLNIFSTWAEQQVPTNERLEWFTLRLLKDNDEFDS